MGRFLMDFGIQVEGQVDQKIDHMASCWQVRRNSKKAKKNIEKPMVFFHVFAISANLPTRGHMIDFLVNLALNLRPKTHQKWCQEAFKISKNGIENMMQVGLAFGALLARILVDFGAKLGGKLEPSWPH